MNLNDAHMAAFTPENITPRDLERICMILNKAYASSPGQIQNLPHPAVEPAQEMALNITSTPQHTAQVIDIRSPETDFAPPMPSDPPHFKFPTGDIDDKLTKSVKLANVIGNKSSDLECFYHEILGSISRFYAKLQSDQLLMNESFHESLNTISIISSITRTFDTKADHGYREPNPEYNLSQVFKDSAPDDQIKNKLEQIKIDYESKNFDGLSSYCTEELCMARFKETIEKTIFNLVPILKEKLSLYTSKLNEFYTKLQKLGPLGKNNNKALSEFLQMIPPFEIVSNFKDDMSIEKIKLTLQSEYKHLNPDMMLRVDTEISNVDSMISEQASILKSLKQQLVTLNHQLYPIDDLQYIARIPNDENLSIMQSISNLQRDVERLTQLQNERRETQSKLINEIEEILSMLYDHSSKQSEYKVKLRSLKVNFYEKNLTELKQLLNTLQIEKKANISKFIFAAREKIVSLWDQLMYDEQSRSYFNDFHIQDESLLTEECLDIHNKYISQLEEEICTLSPFLSEISKLNDILSIKSKYDLLISDKDRFKSRNFRQSLKDETRWKKNIDTNLPPTVQLLSVMINEWETKAGRCFCVDGQEFKVKLEQLNAPYQRNKASRFSSNKTSSKPSAQPSTKRSASTKRTFSQTDDVGTKTPTPASIQNSVIKRKRLSDLSNPFESTKSSPNKQLPALQSSSKLQYSNAKLLSPSKLISPIRRKSQSPLKSSRIPIMNNKFTSPNFDIYQPNNKGNQSVEILTDLDLEKYEQEEQVMEDKENIKPSVSSVPLTQASRDFGKLCNDTKIMPKTPQRIPKSDLSVLDTETF